jgi:3,4-dihydroxy-2-butanone 4-phosphate synthase
MPVAKTKQALAALAQGRPVIVLDDQGRENEGDLIMAAERVTPEAMAFMIRYTSRVVCVALPGRRLDELRLPLMVTENNEAMRTAFTVSVDARRGTTTGISAADRATTVRALACPDTRPEDLARPGRIFPLRALEGGVLRRAGHTEAAVDLARAAGLYPAGILAEVVNDDGTMARRPELAELGLTISERVPLITELTIDNVQYLRTKQAKMGHQLGFSRDATARSIKR